MTEPRTDQGKPEPKQVPESAPPAARLLATAATNAETHRRKPLKASTAKDIAAQVGYTGQGDLYLMQIDGTTSDPQVIVDPNC